MNNNKRAVHEIAITPFRIVQVVVVAGIVCATYYAAVWSGNYYFTESEIFSLLQRKDPSIRSIVSIDRNVIDESEIVAETNNGSLVTYYIDSDQNRVHILSRK